MVGESYLEVEKFFHHPVIHVELVYVHHLLRIRALMGAVVFGVFTHKSFLSVVSLSTSSLGSVILQIFENLIF